MLATFRIHKTNNYFVCPNGFLVDEHLSWRAKGILAYLLSKPDDWVVQIKDVVNHAKEGNKASRSAIQELLQHGYMAKRIVREDGKFVRFEYDVFESANLNPQYLVRAPFSQNGEMVNLPSIYEEIEDGMNKVMVENSNMTYTPGEKRRQRS